MNGAAAGMSVCSAPHLTGLWRTRAAVMDNDPERLPHAGTLLDTGGVAHVFRWPVRSALVGYPCCVNRSVLAGPDGHPFHPLVVPLPIGAFVSSLIFDILTRTRAAGLPYLVDGAFWLIGVGLIGALVAAVFGLLDLRAIPRRTPAFATARTHLALNAATAALFAADYAWRAGDHVELDKTRWGQLALSAAAVAFLIAAMWLGGKLTYHHGMRVTARADR